MDLRPDKRKHSGDECQLQLIQGIRNRQLDSPQKRGHYRKIEIGRFVGSCS